MPKKVKKVLHICIIITIIVAIGFTALMLILKYNENGETNMPFEVSKITIVSTIDAEDVEDNSNRWNVKVSQNNDIYIDIKKNEEYAKNRIIKSINLINFKITQKPLIGDTINIYKPSTNKLKNFENIDELKVSEIIYEGAQETDIKNLKISNQGGRLSFRCANINLGNYVSNEETDLNYKDLLKKIETTDEELVAKVSFDIEILLTNKKCFKANMEVEVPVLGIVQEGTTSIEIENPEIIFKRVEN